MSSSEKASGTALVLARELVESLVPLRLDTLELLEAFLATVSSAKDSSTVVLTSVSSSRGFFGEAFGFFLRPAERALDLDLDLAERAAFLKELVFGLMTSLASIVKTVPFSYSTSYSFSSGLMSCTWRMVVLNFIQHHYVHLCIIKQFGPGPLCHDSISSFKLH